MAANFNPVNQQGQWSQNLDGTWSGPDGQLYANQGDTTPIAAKAPPVPQMGGGTDPGAPPPQQTPTGGVTTGWTQGAGGAWTYSAPPSGTGGGGGGATNTGGSLIAPYNVPPPQTPGTGIDYVPGTPQYSGPPVKTADPFTAPSVDQALNDPGYKFRMQQGQDALQNWAAAKGTLNDSGTAKALIDYGQGAASQEYGNVWDRAYNAYNTNLNSQYVLPFTQASQNSTTQNANNMTGYTTQAVAGQYQKNADYLDAYNTWLAQYGIYDKNQSDTFNRQLTLATA